jgi:RNA polymerase sporulation-specific sigma factor
MYIMEFTVDNKAQYSDETLCSLVASGDRIAEEVLVMRYNRLVRICSRPFFLAGGDSEDLIQEAMFGLLKAIREFDPSRDVSFRTFAEVCIRNRIRSVVTAALRGKHTPLNNSVPMEALLDIVSSPEDSLIGREERAERLRQVTDRLSPFEQEVLFLYLDGYSYDEIGRQLGRPAKSVDNAVQRIRRKVAQ